MSSPAKSSTSNNDDNVPSTPRRSARAKTPTSTRKTRNTPAKTPSRPVGSVPQTPTRNVPATPSRLTQTPQRATPAKSVNPSPSSRMSPMAVGGMSEIDLSSPLNYGTPLSSVRTPHSGIQGTPVRMRFDIRNQKTLRQVAISSESGTTEEAAAPQLVIYGTDVVVNECKAKFKKFITRFLEDSPEIDERFRDIDTSKPLYIQKLEQIHNLEEPFLNLNCSHLKSFDINLYNQLVRYPQEVIPTFDMAVNEIFFEKYPAASLSHQIQVRPFNATKTKNMRGLDPEDIDQLITITGMVTRTSGAIPEMREGFFECQVCDYSVSQEVDRGYIAEPIVCTNCQSKHCFTLIHNRSQFSDKQMIKLQETPEDAPAGETPHIIQIFAHNDLVDQVKAGDRIAVSGIFRATSKQINPRQRNLRAVFTTHVDAVHFRKIDPSRLFVQDIDGGDKQEHIYAAGRIDEILKLSQVPDIYEQLARAIAPQIYENEDVKKGILLLLFGGARKDFSKYGRGQCRSEINILLCGDPGTSKSQLLQYVYHLLPRSQYTSGKGSSAVGLTAYLAKDPDTKHHVLHSGALVLADNGVCCIDEFDKMNDSTRSILHEVMEQQTLSIAKAGIVCQLTARTSILAAANPSGSQWNKDKTIIENIQLPHTLLSRFDLIFLMLDPQNEIFDRRLARHLVSLYYSKKSSDYDGDLTIDMKLLRDYIAYAKEHIQPRLSQSSGQLLVRKYVQMRQIGAGHGQVSAYPRQLESLIRLSEAHARMRLSELVEECDVEEAYRLHREALKQSATDPLSGRIDVGILTTGLSVLARQRRAEIIKTLTQMIENHKARTTPINQQKLLEELRTKMDITVTREAYEDALKGLQDENLIALVGKNTLRIL